MPSALPLWAAARAADPAEAQQTKPSARPGFPSPKLGFCCGVLCVLFCSVSPPLPARGPTPSLPPHLPPLSPPPPGLPASPLLTSSTKSIARARADPLPPSSRPAPPPGFLLGIMGALCGLISLLRGREARSASPAAVGENESGIRPGPRPTA